MMPPLKDPTPQSSWMVNWGLSFLIGMGVPLVWRFWEMRAETRIIFRHVIVTQVRVDALKDSLDALRNSRAIPSEPPRQGDER